MSRSEDINDSIEHCNSFHPENEIVDEKTVQFDKFQKSLSNLRYLAKQLWQIYLDLKIPIIRQIALLLTQVGCKLFTYAKTYSDKNDTFYYNQRPRGLDNGTYEKKDKNLRRLMKTMHFIEENKQKLVLLDKGILEPPALINPNKSMYHLRREVSNDYISLQEKINWDGKLFSSRYINKYGFCSQKTQSIQGVSADFNPDIIQYICKKKLIQEQEDIDDLERIEYQSIYVIIIYFLYRNIEMARSNQVLWISRQEWRDRLVGKTFNAKRQAHLFLNKLVEGIWEGGLLKNYIDPKKPKKHFYICKKYTQLYVGELLEENIRQFHGRGKWIQQDGSKFKGQFNIAFQKQLQGKQYIKEKDIY